MDNKAGLADSLWKIMAGKFTSSNDVNILDDGALPHL